MLILIKLINQLFYVVLGLKSEFHESRPIGL